MLEHLAGPISSVMAEMTNKTDERTYHTIVIAVRFANRAVGSLVGTYDSSYTYPDAQYIEITGTLGRALIRDTAPEFTVSRVGSETHEVWRASDGSRSFVRAGRTRRQLNPTQTKICTGPPAGHARSSCAMAGPDFSAPPSATTGRLLVDPTTMISFVLRSGDTAAYGSSHLEGRENGPRACSDFGTACRRPPTTTAANTHNAARWPKPALPSPQSPTPPTTRTRTTHLTPTRARSGLTVELAVPRPAQSAASPEQTGSRRRVGRRSSSRSNCESLIGVELGEGVGLTSEPRASPSSLRPCSRRNRGRSCGRGGRR